MDNDWTKQFCGYCHTPLVEKPLFTSFYKHCPRCEPELVKTEPNDNDHEFPNWSDLKNDYTIDYMAPDNAPVGGHVKLPPGVTVVTSVNGRTGNTKVSRFSSTPPTPGSTLNSPGIYRVMGIEPGTTGRVASWVTFAKSAMDAMDVAVKDGHLVSPFQCDKVRP